MKIKNFRWQNFLVVSLYVLTYPALKAFTSGGNRLLVFLDVLTIVSTVMVLIGVLNHLYLKGDFDATRYIFVRKMSGKEIDYDRYIKEKQEQKKDRFNYPLFTGLFYLVLAYIASRIFY